MFAAVTRGLALFLGAFSLLNLAGDLRFAHANANIWWIDFWPLPAALRMLLLAAVALGLLAYGFGMRRGAITTIPLALAALAAVANVVRYYQALARGAITTSLPVPLSLLIAVACAASSILFPVAQIVFFGVTDYRRPAGLIVVFGARAYADGSLSESLADRVRTGCELYRAGLAPRLIVSGGPGEGAVHETEAMRRAAIAQGVPASAIDVDANGINTEATVRNTARRSSRILAVSSFYHLPRIKMTYQRYGVEAFTVPARATSQTALAYNMGRETLAFWAYYLRRLR